jgi:hypothetical protein
LAFIERVPQGLCQWREHDRLIFDRVKYHFVCSLFWIIFAVLSDRELEKNRGAVVHVSVERYTDNGEPSDVPTNWKALTYTYLTFLTKTLKLQQSNSVLKSLKINKKLFKLFSLPWFPISV